MQQSENRPDELPVLAKRLIIGLVSWELYYYQDLWVGEGVRLAARHHHHLLAQWGLDQKLHDASAHVPRRAQHDRRLLPLRLYRCHRHVKRARNQKYTQVRERVKFCW